MATDKAPQPGDTLGDRIKKYERASRPFLSPNTPVLIRVDGKAFHTWTRHMEKPFDPALVQAMQDTTAVVSISMQGFKLAYTQSDEATFMLTDTDRLESQPWMDYSVNKLVSVTASMFTYHFNRLAEQYFGTRALAPAYFDARAFNVPAEDVPNAFLWRQRDWERNSLMMYARSFYSHAKLHKKNASQVHDLLHEYDVNWTDLDQELKNGTFITSSRNFICEKMDYAGIQRLIEAPPELLLVSLDLAWLCQVVPVCQD